MHCSRWSKDTFSALVNPTCNTNTDKARPIQSNIIKSELTFCRSRKQSMLSSLVSSLWSSESFSTPTPSLFSNFLSPRLEKSKTCGSSAKQKPRSVERSLTRRRSAPLASNTVLDHLGYRDALPEFEQTSFVGPMTSNQADSDCLVKLDNS